MKLVETVKIAKESLKVSNQVYHINCARKEYGDEKVIVELASHIRHVRNVTVPESMSAAATVLVSIDDFSTERIEGKKIRQSLHAQGNLIDMNTGHTELYI